MKNLEWAKAGFIMGALLSVVLPLLVAIPSFGITFSIYNIRDNITQYVGAGTVFGQYLLSFVGELSLPGLVVAGLGMGVLVLLARFVVGALKFIPVKYTFPAVFVVAALAQGMIMTLQLPVFEFMPLVYLAITAFILSFLLKVIYKQLHWSIPA